ncbi:YopX family protein [Campylobacter jejuni]
MKLIDFDFRIWEKGKYRKCLLTRDGLNNKMSLELLNGKELDLETEIELCTGLCDKNGKKIFEGDILSYKTFQGGTLFYFVTMNKDINIFEIFRIADLEKFTLFNTLETDRFSLYLFHKINDMKDVEVIGNIHENKDLFENIEKKCEKD